MSTLGEKLRQARESRGVTISEIAEQTRISAHYLEAIESNDYRPLPGGIFNKGFVKAYAKYVGIDEQEALQDYSRIIAEQGDRLSEPEVKVYRPEVLTDGGNTSSMIPTLIFAAVILGLMTWGILWAVDWYQKSQMPMAANNAANSSAKPAPAPSPAAGPATPAASNNIAAASPATATPATPAAGATPELPASPNQIKVELKSTSTDPNDSPNVTSFLDGKYLSEMILPDNPVRTYEPEKTLKIRYSKWQAKNLQMTINGKPVAIPIAPLKAKDQGIEFEINYDNLAQILQSGAISLAPATAVNANAANTAATSANSAPKQ